MNWFFFVEIIYMILVVLVCLLVVYDTRSTTKASAYILLVIFVPIIGMAVYFSFGINYRKRKMYSKSLISKDQETRILNKVELYQNQLFDKHPVSFEKYGGVSKLIFNAGNFPVSENNHVELLVNGEEKFPVVLDAIFHAHHHIHLEYYIFDSGDVGDQLMNALIDKAKEGVEIRFMYDDFGSRKLKKPDISRMREAGIEIHPFYKVRLPFLANRINYRNHRKIIIIDGRIGFTGGINVANRYVNDPKFQNPYFWRDTHIKIEGSGVLSLQQIFLADWNYASGQNLRPNPQYFPIPEQVHPKNQLVQIVGSGPDSPTPLILQSLNRAISLATEEILITSPYFIPSDTMKDILIMMAQSGVSVKLLVPGISDSKLVNRVSQSNYSALIQAGVEIFTYQKGFVHAKTMVIDRDLAVIGTANMDLRSFDLNFEVNAMIYDSEVAGELANIFYRDLLDSDKIDPVEWDQRPLYQQLINKLVGLFSPLM